MKYYLPKRSNGDPVSSFDEYARRTELITKMMLAKWLKPYEIREYIEGIIKEATVVGNDGAILWCVDKPDNMPFDARKAYIYNPLYNIVVFMVKAYFEEPGLMNEMDGFRDTIKGATLSISKVTLNDETVEFLDSSGVYQFLYYFPDICPELFKLLEEYRGIATCERK